MRQAAQANVLASVTKAAPRDVLADAVRSAARREPFFTKEWAAAIDGDPELEHIELTKRQKEVLMLTASVKLLATLRKPFTSARTPSPRISGKSVMTTVWPVTTSIPRARITGRSSSDFVAGPAYTGEDADAVNT
jgi:hypothetical protein